MSFHVPKYDDVPEDGNNLPDEGRYDVTVTGIEATRSSKGDPMMVWTETIDNGPSAGYELKEYFAFKEGSMLAWARLKNICQAAGIQWQEKPSLEAFASQFPLNEIRFSVDVVHQHSVKGYTDVDNKWKYERLTPEPTDETPYENWVTVPKTQWEEWEGEKNVRAIVNDDLAALTEIYQPPQGKRELQFSEDHMEPAMIGDGAFEPGGEDDGLPF